MSLDNALIDAMEIVPECLASGYVDMDSGRLISLTTIDSHPQAVIDTLPEATADLFQGPTVVHIENIYKQVRGNQGDDHHYFQEIIVFSEYLLHVFMRSKKHPNHVICFVCRKKANPGMVLTMSRRALEPISEAA